MRHNVQHFSERLDGYVDSVSRLSKNFCDQLEITLFGFVRVRRSGTLSWVTSNPLQDQFLLESHSLCTDPLFDSPEKMIDGQYLWFHDREFAGCEAFYRDRVKHFKVDHGMVLLRQGKGYVDMCCFSGLLSKRPLYNLFMNEQRLFQTFMSHFTSSLILASRRGK